MKLRKILAAAMAMAMFGVGSVPCYRQYPLKTMTANAGSDEEYAEFKDSVLTYKIYDDHAEISQCDKDATGELIIPSEIEGVSVTSIGFRSFQDCVYLQSVTIPDSVTSIGQTAFDGCISLEYIRIPNSITEIKSFTFYRCENLKSVTLPDSVIFIGVQSFAECKSLTSIAIPAHVLSFQACAFQDCENLETITIPPSVERFASDTFSGTKWLNNKRRENPLVVVNGVLIDGKTCSGDVVIPDSVTSISAGAFENCENLVSVTIPASVTEIGYESFAKCKSLKTVTILNPKCKISDYTETIYTSRKSVEYGYEYSGVIRGDVNSTAQAYARKFGKTFEAIGVETSTTTTSTTTTATTSTTAQETTTTTTATPEQPAVVFGDPTGDGKVDSKDASFVLVEYAKLSTGGESSLTEAEKNAADVNKDGKNDSKDASIILSYYAYISTSGTDSLEEFLKNQ